MQLGIIGLPKSGKTTLFNILTQGRPQGATSSQSQVGTAKVWDKRLEGLTSLVKPKKVVPAEVQYIDAAILKAKHGITTALRTQLGTTDAFLHVVRFFPDAAVPHPEGSIDAARDIEAMTVDLCLADLDILEKRLGKITEHLKGSRGVERDTLIREQALLERIETGLENEVPVRFQTLTEEEAKLLRNYDLLSAKPLMVVLNIGEGQLAQQTDLEAGLTKRFPGLEMAAICAKLELELAALSPPEAVEFRVSMAIGEEAIRRIIRMSYEVLHLVTFFTIASNEVRAWTVPHGTLAPSAAGKIHTDMEKGFIRAEVIRYEDLISSGSLAEAKSRGLVRLEGKTCPVKDGDVITFLFKV